MNARLLTITSLLVLGLPLRAAVLGSVTGMVVDDSGKPVVRARVFIHAAYPPGMAKSPVGPPVVTGPQVITTMTDRTGAFIAGHLPNGHYVACAHPAAPGLLNSCHWAAAVPEFTVVAGKATAPVKITLTRGFVLPIHVNDPQQLLTPAKGVIEGDLAFHLVTAKGHHYPIFIVGSSKTSRDHSITVPFGTSVTVQAFGPHLVLNDDSGKPAAAVGKTINIPVTSSAAALVYTVAGAKQ